MKFQGPLPYTIPLEEAEEARSRLSTPIESFMAEEARSQVIQALPYTRWQMIFLLMEYGFSDHEIAKNMRLQAKSVQNVRYFIRKQLRGQG